MSPSPFCVTYHFVADPEETPWPRLVSRGRRAFEAQLDYLCAHHEPLTLEQIRAFFGQGAALPSDGFLLTFDHATRDHLEIVLPALESRGLQGTFFVYTHVIDQGRICSVDKQRFLEYSFEDYLDLLKHFAEHVMRRCPDLDPRSIEPNARNLEQTRHYLAQFPFYSDGERFFRHLRDRVLLPSVFEEAISAMFQEVFGSEAEFARAHYLSWDDLSTLRNAGMEIGGHGHRHLPMPRTPPEVQLADVQTCVHLLRQRLRVPADVFAYPNGDYNPETLSALRTSGVTLAFTTDPGAGISKGRPLEIGRIDTAFLPTKAGAGRLDGGPRGE